MKKIVPIKRDYSSLISSIDTLLEQGRMRAYQAINTILTKTYWEIGRTIVEYEQKGKEKAEYGSELLDNISRDLKQRYGKGFSRDNLEKMRKFYVLFRNSADTACGNCHGAIIA
jgi:hypothetical protein